MAGAATATRARRWPRLRRTPRIYLHIGTMKSGTSYLQSLMSANRAALSAAGWCFPGEAWSVQSLAVQDVLFETDDERVASLTSGMWDTVVKEMLGHDGKGAILSMEFLSFASPEAARRVVESFGDAEVHVVLTVRDATSAIPAQWQTHSRNGGKLTYPSFIRGIAKVLKDADGAEGKGARLFQRTQGIPRMIQTWLPLVGPKRFHVITVPPRGADPEELWKRFASVVGVKPHVITNHEVPSNPSLGHASSELLRLLNTELGRSSELEYRLFVKGALVRNVLELRKDDEQPLRLNARGQRLASRWNGRVRAAITDSKVDLVGSLDELPVREPDPGAPSELPAPTEAELLGAAATARDGMLAIIARLESLRGVEPGPVPEGSWTNPTFDPRRPDFMPEGWMGKTSPDHWDGSSDPVKSAVAELAELVEQGVAVHRELNASTA